MRQLTDRFVWARLALCGAALTSFTACGPELDPISQIKTLRIMGVQKSASYARPGETVDMHMLWEEGREEIPDVEIFWGFWCYNPPGASYAGCLGQPPNVDPPVFATNQSNFSITIPEDGLQAPADPRLPEAGVAFVFYAICPGTLDVPDYESPTSFTGDVTSLLPTCLDDQGNKLGPEDFTVGYSSIFIYEELRNENPIVTGFRVNGEEIEADCIDADCSDPFPIPETDECEDGVACFEICEDDADLFTCPEIEIEAIVDPASAEQDELAKVAFGTELQESIWVSYFVDRGALAPELKLVNDADKGWQEDISTELFAPKEPGPVRLWAVVRDNRGGASWIRIPAFAEPK